MRTYLCIILIICLYFCQCHYTNKPVPHNSKVDSVMVDSIKCDSILMDTTEMVMGAAVDVQHAHTLPTCTLSIAQMDSMIKADELPQLDKWTKNNLQDYETKTNTEYMTLFDKTSNTVYTVKTLNRRQYVVSKRIIK